MDKKFKNVTWSKPSAEQVESRTGSENRVLLDTVQQFETMQSTNMERMAEVIESDPALKAQMEQARRDEHLQKFGSLDFSQLEERVSDTFSHTSGKTRGVVHRYPTMRDSLPRDGRIKADGNLRRRLIQCDTHLGDTKIMDLSDDATLTAQVAEFNRAATKQLTEMLGVKGDILTESGDGQSAPEKHLSYIDEAPFIPNHLPQNYLQSEKGSGCPVGPLGSCGRALRIDANKGWRRIDTSRDRAATSASARKKLRSKTRAQKKARRKQR